jgi:hypothetical protein
MVYVEKEWGRKVEKQRVMCVGWLKEGKKTDETKGPISERVCLWRGCTSTVGKKEKEWESWRKGT